MFQQSGGRFTDLKKTLQFPERDTSLSMKNTHLLSQNCNMRQDSSSKSEGEVTSLSGVDKREVRDNREKW
jgi:hypothetical protein